MIAEISDHNLSGHITVEVESPEELADILARYSGTWHDFGGDSTGVALLSEPYGRVYIDGPDDFDPYPDFVVETEDGETWTVSPA